MYIEKDSLTNAFIALCKQLSANGVSATRRGKEVVEIPSAVLVCITNPTDRYINIPERKWNKTLGWIESLWIARGDNSLEMPAAYVKNLVNFSDDGEYMRAGYGVRLRRYGDHFYAMGLQNGEKAVFQYKNKEGLSNNIKYSGLCTDQLKFVVEKFKQDLSTREAVITIADPIADNFHKNDDDEYVILETKDTPCTRSIHFMIVDGLMNCYVDIRSNDIWWGFSAVNVFNFTLMQEYVATMVGVPIGKYYHKVDNMHVYADFLPMVEDVAKMDEVPLTERFSYISTFKTLSDFDDKLVELTEFEEECRKGTSFCETLKPHIHSFTDPLFMDWAKVIYKYWYKDYDEMFINPHLNRLFYGNEK